MVEFNLLPWREQTRIYQLKIVKIILSFSVFLAIIIIVGFNFLLSHQLTKCNSQIANIKQKLDQSNSIATNVNQMNQLLSVNVFPDIDYYRDATKSLLMTLIDKDQTSLCYMAMSRKKNKIKLTGYTVSLANLNQLVQAWQKQQRFNEVKINKFEQHHHAIKFYLTILEKNIIPFTIPGKKSRDGL